MAWRCLSFYCLVFEPLLMREYVSNKYFKNTIIDKIPPTSREAANQQEVTVQSSLKMNLNFQKT